MLRHTLWIAAVLEVANILSSTRVITRYDGSLYNLARLKAKTKTNCVPITELLYADDSALLAHSENEMQGIINKFSKVASKFGLVINIEKPWCCFNLYQAKSSQPQQFHSTSPC